MKSLLTLLTIIFFISISIGQNVVINEFMSSNHSSVQDIDGENSDWIEFYNSTNASINLLDYKLSDDASDFNKWTFPSVIIQPNSFLLVFASGKNILDTTELHTNFKISSGGEKLFLSDNNGAIIDQTLSVSLSADQSYGRVPDGSNNWIVINTPSPKESNNSSNQLIFSHQEGFYTEPFTLELSSALSDTIYYTLNGDIPTENSSFFKDSLVINNRSSEPNIVSEHRTTPEQNLISFKAWESPKELIDKATILRCASFKNGKRTSKIYSKTFFVDPDIFEKYTVPVISLITENRNFFDVNTGIYIPGIYYDSLNPEWTGNYFMRGDNWEKDVHIEYFENDGNKGFSQDAGVRIHGGKTRHAAQKSLRLYARNDYGEKYFNYKIFPQKQVSKYKRLILRTTMGSWDAPTIIKDLLAHDISRDLNIEHQDFQPVIVYLNGEYWGIQTLRDRIDERYLGYTHNIDPDLTEFKEDGNTDFENLISFIENNDLSNNGNYEFIKTQIDIDNYIDYTVAEHFFANYDWPANNIKIWRALPHGKWRWVFYDLDAGFGDANFDMLTHSTMNDPAIWWPNSPASTFLFRNLLKNKEFENRLINRFTEVLNSEFEIKAMTEKFHTIKKLYEPEVSLHYKRWDSFNSLENWKSVINEELLDFIKKRPCYLAENIKSYFDLKNFYFYCFAENISGNDLILAPNPSRGFFYIYNNGVDIENASIKISNAFGQIVYSEENINLKKNERKDLILPHIKSGTYFLQVISNTYSNQKKIVILN